MNGYRELAVYTVRVIVLSPLWLPLALLTFIMVAANDPRAERIASIVNRIIGDGLR